MWYLLLYHGLADNFPISGLNGLEFDSLRNRRFISYQLEKARPLLDPAFRKQSYFSVD